MLTEHVVPPTLSARLSSLAGIQADLEQAKAYCERLVERYAGEHLKLSPFDIVGFTTHIDFLEWEALSAAACVAYARCFTSGVRQTLDQQELEQADPEFKALHAHLLHLRNKHIAHSVNSFEENNVTIQLHAQMKEAQEIAAVVPRHERSGALSIGHPSKLLLLVNWWLARTHTEMQAEMARVLASVKAMQIDALRQLPIWRSSTYEARAIAVDKRRPHE